MSHQCRRIPAAGSAAFSLLILACLSPATASAEAKRFTLNRDHTDVVFEISHLGFSMKHGWFRDISGTLNLDADMPQSSSVDIVIKAASIDTNHEKRDKDLRDPKFLNVEMFPEMNFVSTTVTRTGPDTADVLGNLTLRGVTKPLLLHAKFNKMGPNPITGSVAAGFSARGALKRSDFGIATMIPMIGDEVMISIDTEFDAAK